MVRGNQKATAQAKAQAKADSKKAGKSDLKARGAALQITCDVGKSPMINYTQLKQHYESKHPKETFHRTRTRSHARRSGPHETCAS